MAQRGSPLPFAIREAIKQLRQQSTVRATAASVGVSKTTVQKYGKQNGTK